MILFHFVGGWDHLILYLNPPSTLFRPLALSRFLQRTAGMLAKTGALRQTQLPVSSAGRGRCVCPCRCGPAPSGGSMPVATPFSFGYSKLSGRGFACCAAYTQKEQFTVQSPGRGGGAAAGVPLKGRVGGSKSSPGSSVKPSGRASAVRVGRCRKVFGHKKSLSDRMQNKNPHS